MVWYQGQGPTQQQSGEMDAMRQQLMRNVQGSRGLSTGFKQQVMALYGEDLSQGGGTQVTGAQVRQFSQNNLGLQGQRGYSAGQQGQRSLAPGGTNLNDLASYLANQYGVALGRQPLVDERGNFLRMPTSADEAIKFQFISQAIADEQNRRAQQKATSAMQAGIGQVQSRSRGALSQLTSGKYERLADVYSREQHRSADFSYFVQKEQLEKMESIISRQERLAKKGARNALVSGLIFAALGGAAGGLSGAAAGFQLGANAGQMGAQAGWW